MMRTFIFQMLRQCGWARKTGARLLGAILALAMMGAGEARAQSVVNGGDVNVYVGVKTIGVSVTSNTPALGALMTRAFSLHGAFHLVQSGEAPDYVLHFDTNGGNDVTVTAEPKTLGGKAVHQDVTGANWRDAAYRAGDYAVQALTNLPGIFAGKLAFVSKRTGVREIYTSDLLGQEIFQRTNDRADSLNPHWSPDGTKILYTGYYRTGFMELDLLDLTRGQRRPFTFYKGVNTGGVYSPDGQHVAMILSSRDHVQLFVSDAEGSPGSMRALTTTTTSKSSPTWSPDGTVIALSSDPRGSPLLYQIPAAGGTMRTVPMADPLSIYCTEAAWNPRDPNSLVFTAAEGEGLQIALYDFKTHEAKWLALLGDSNMEPCWANDGRHVIYTSRTRSGLMRLAIVDTQTGHNAYLTSKDAFQAAYVYPR